MNSIQYQKPENECATGMQGEVFVRGEDLPCGKIAKGGLTKQKEIVVRQDEHGNPLRDKDGRLLIDNSGLHADVLLEPGEVLRVLYLLLDRTENNVACLTTDPEIFRQLNGNVSFWDLVPTNITMKDSPKYGHVIITDYDEHGDQILRLSEEPSRHFLEANPL